MLAESTNRKMGGARGPLIAAGALLLLFGAIALVPVFPSPRGAAASYAILDVILAGATTVPMRRLIDAARTGHRSEDAGIPGPMETTLWETVPPVLCVSAGAALAVVATTPDHAVTAAFGGALIAVFATLWTASAFLRASALRRADRGRGAE